MIGLVVTFLIGFIYFGPKMIRMLKAEFIWIVSRIRAWMGHQVEGKLKASHQEVIDGIAPYLQTRSLRFSIQTSD